MDSSKGHACAHIHMHMCANINGTAASYVAQPRTLAILHHLPLWLCWIYICRDTSCTGIAVELQICNTCSSVFQWICLSEDDFSQATSAVEQLLITHLQHAQAGRYCASAVAFFKGRMIGRQHMGAIVKSSIHNSQQLICNYNFSTDDAEHACAI